MKKAILFAVLGIIVVHYQGEPFSVSDGDWAFVLKEVKANGLKIRSGIPTAKAETNYTRPVKYRWHYITCSDLDGCALHIGVD